MKIAKVTLTMAALILSRVGAAQVYFNEQIDWARNYEYLSAITVSDDGQSIFVVGGAGDLLSTENFTVLANLTTEGNVNWQQKFLPKPDLYGETHYLSRLENNNVVLLGNYEKTLGNGVYDRQIYLTKMNLKTGDTLWTKEHGNSSYVEQGRTIQLAKDQGLLVSGTTFLANNTEHSRMLFMKTDSLGNLVFRREYSTQFNYDHYAYTFINAEDGGYLIFGYRGYEGPYLGGFGTEHKLDMVLVKTDAQGNQQWVKVYPPWEWKQILFYGRDIQPLPGGDFLMVGLKGYALYQPGNTYAGNYFFARLNSAGAILDSVTLPGLHELNRINRLKPAFDGSFWAIGADKDSLNTAQTGLIIKISPDLDILWKREYRVSPPESTRHEMFYDGVEMPDRGFVLAGTAYGQFADSTNQNGWLIRVDSFGCLEPGCQLSSAVEDPPSGAIDLGILISPNPTSAQALLKLTHEGAVLLGVRVLDVQGQVVSDMQFLRDAAWREWDIDLGGEAAGMYWVQVRTSEGWATKKIIRQ